MCVLCDTKLHPHTHLYIWLNATFLQLILFIPLCGLVCLLSKEAPPSKKVPIFFFNFPKDYFGKVRFFLGYIVLPPCKNRMLSMMYFCVYLQVRWAVTTRPTPPEASQLLRWQLLPPQLPPSKATG